MLALYGRHYSAYDYADRRKRSQCVGPGEVIFLRTAEPTAMFVWRKFIDDAQPPQEGVNCAVFRNEGPHLSSLLIRQADAIADHVWPGERHYTYVNPKGHRRRRSGACFKHAGWLRCGRTKGGLLIMERASSSLTPAPQDEGRSPSAGEAPADQNPHPPILAREEPK